MAENFDMARPSYNLPQALGLGGIFALAIFAIAHGSDSDPVSWSEPSVLDPGDQQMHPLLRVVASTLVGMALGTVVTLTMAARNRFPASLVVSIGRIVGALFLAGFFPLALMGIIPLTPLGFGFVVLAGAVLGGIPAMDAAAAISTAVAGTLLLSLLTYLPASLVISGVRSRSVRVILFGQLWFGAYGAAMLIYRCCSFSI